MVPSSRKRKSLAIRFDIDTDVNEARCSFINRAISQLEHILPDMNRMVSVPFAQRHYLRRAAYAVGKIYDAGVDDLDR